MKILTALVATLLTLVLLEVVVRITGLESASFHAIGGFTRYDPTVGWKLVPGLKKVFRGRDFSVRVEHNASGWRDRDYEERRKEGGRRIAVVGDSVVWCWGVEMDECFTERLEAELPDTEVLAFGIPSFGTVQELLVYENDVRPYSPDLVILSMIGNDPTDNLATKYRPAFELRDGELLLSSEPVSRRKSAFKEWLKDTSRLYVQVDYAFQVVGHLLEAWRKGAELGDDGFRQTPPADEAKAWEVMEAVLNRFQRSVSEDGAEFAILLLDGIPALERRITDYSDKREVELINLIDVLRSAESEGVEVRFETDPHYTPAAQEIIAAELRRFIARRANGAGPGESTSRAFLSKP